MTIHLSLVSEGQHHAIRTSRPETLKQTAKSTIVFMSYVRSKENSHTNTKKIPVWAVSYTVQYATSGAQKNFKQAKSKTPAPTTIQPQQTAESQADMVAKIMASVINQITTLLHQPSGKRDTIPTTLLTLSETRTLQAFLPTAQKRRQSWAEFRKRQQPWLNGTEPWPRRKSLSSHVWRKSANLPVTCADISNKHGKSPQPCVPISIETENLCSVFGKLTSASDSDMATWLSSTSAEV